jgi:hypothetical protein
MQGAAPFESKRREAGPPAHRYNRFSRKETSDGKARNIPLARFGSWIALGQCAAHQRRDGRGGLKEDRVTYRIEGLDPASFAPLFGLTDEELAGRGIVRMRVTEKPNFPCRIRLADANVGETVLLLNHVSHDVANPYRASHAIFVTEGEEKAAEYIDEVPPVFEKRVLSFRGFDAQGMMADAILTQPGEADEGIRKLFENPEIATIHAHNATRGCFSAKIERA